MKLEINNKTLAIAGGTIAVIAGIVGGAVAYNKHVAAEQERKEKEAAELAYANRPIIDEVCLMNGVGSGHCDFTNTGKSEGAICGVIVVQGPGMAQSGKFCSGTVEPKSTRKVEFMIPEVDDLCDNGYRSWTEKCAFGFVQDGLNGGDTVGA